MIFQYKTEIYSLLRLMTEFVLTLVIFLFTNLYLKKKKNKLRKNIFRRKKRNKILNGKWTLDIMGMWELYRDYQEKLYLFILKS